MPTLNLSAKARLVLYIASGVGAAVIAYLATKGLIGDAEVGLWATIAALVNGLAALNVSDTGAARAQHAARQADRNAAQNER